ncbi:MULTISPECIES: DUF1697 domain-containing protein [unclassified Sphingomonas]|uniref:DUF1697 domain-containing protein n=1 Tax=unclassified Sphingomonas TaxID=196159 RepID=UPI002151A2F9|nr:MULTISPECIES: DUF1697 domain-containing protein [unclassified Sphingomonas]MCR5870398.1 DUF1697 domain-containing protein [Sphingomonas sp. J344]UUY01262.1 DUF1697 domain-containing protein [Sphingomonas sp. J315]
MRWAALLRGINLGKRQLKSAELKAVVEGLGFTDVKILLASGNVVFTAPGAKAEALEAQIHDELEKQTGLKSEIFVRTPEDMAAVVATNPFPDAARDRPSFLVVTFHRKPVDGDAVAALMADYDGPERAQAIDRELYIDFPEGQARSMLHAPLGKATRDPVTTARNWNTVLKIRDAL